MAAVILLSGCGGEKSPPAASEAAAQSSTDDAAPKEPVVWSAALVPDSAKAGDVVVLEVRAVIGAGWSIQPLGAPGGAGTATTLELELPMGLEPVGELAAPEPTQSFAKPGAALVYEGDIVFRQSFKIAADEKAGELKVECEVGFQACDAEMCLRPEKVRVAAVVLVED